MNAPTQKAFAAADAMLERGDPVQAERIYREALANGGPLAAYHNLGVALRTQGRFTEAREVLEQVHARAPDDPDTGLVLGTMRLGTGDFAGGWPLYDLRLKRPDTFNTETPPVPAWRGESLAGKVIVVWREQGFGDQVQCARFLPALRDRGARVLVVTSPELVRLFTTMGFEAFPLAPGLEVTVPVRPDYHSHPFSLPRWLGVTVETIPAAPYLHAQAQTGHGRIGVVWRGRAAHQFDVLRSIPDALGARLLEIPGAVHLAPESTGARDMQETAEIIAGLDLVVTVDTSVAHLAGALGKPTRILLPAHGLDWRWMERRADSPWYRTATLYRQEAPGEWAGVLERVTRDL